MADLVSQWTYYQLSNSGEQTQKTWADSLKSICTVNTQSELLYTLDEVEKIGMENFNDLNFFKNGIQPMWEDLSNVNGGRCMAEIGTNHKDVITTLWNRTVALCALDTFEGICGCVFNEKSNFRISIWISDPRYSEEILQAWKEVLDNCFVVYSFSMHNKYSESSKSKKKFSNRSK